MRRTQLTERRTTGGKRGERNKLFKITSHGGMTRGATVTFKRTAVLFVVIGLCSVSGTRSDQTVPPVHPGVPAAVPNGPQELRLEDDVGSEDDEGSDAYGDSTSQEERCEDGWKFLDEACYLFETCRLNWNSAKQACEEAGAQLLVINSRAELIEVKGEMKEVNQRAGILYWWIGLQRNASYGSATSGWQWLDQSPLSEDLPEWDRGQPNNLNGNQECAELDYAEEMNDDSCNSYNPYICEKIPQLHSSSFWLSTTSMMVNNLTVRNKDDEHDNDPVDNSTVRNRDDEHGDYPPRIAIIASEVAVGLVIIVLIVILILVKRRRGAQSGETVPPAAPEEIRTVALPEGSQGSRPNQEEAAETYENMLMGKVGQRCMYTPYSSCRNQPALRVMPPQKDHQEEVYEIVS